MKDEHIWIIVIAAVFAIFLVSGFGGMMGFGNYWMPHMDYGQTGSYWTYGFGWMGVFMILTWILLITALIFGIIWLMKQIRK